MNKIIKLSLIASMVSVSLNAAISQKVIDKINSLESQINELKDSQLDINDELEERIDEVETSTMTDKIKFGLEFRTRVDNFDSKTANGTTGSDNNIWSNRLRLNMKSKITDDMKFSGRLSMYKNWADSNINNFSGMDPMQARRPSDSGVFVERAYVDWTVLSGSVPVVLTIGRQPSSDGPSHQFKDNTVRKATYSALSFDGAADGLVATVNLQKVTEVNGMALRVGYGKGYQDQSAQSYVGNPNGIKDSNVLGVFFDTGLGVNGSLMQLSAVQATDMVSNVPGDNKNIGDMTLYTAMLEFTNIKNSGLDLFAHYAISQAKPNGETSNYNGMNVGLLQTNMMGGTTVGTESIDGSAYWVGARYALPIEAMKNPRIGVEYNYGDENWFSFTQGSNDLSNKLATRGTALEVYYIQPINRYAHIRLGAQMIDNEYTGSGYQIGSPMKIADVGAMAPNEIDTLDNFYLLFNVAY